MANVQLETKGSQIRHRILTHGKTNHQSNYTTHETWQDTGLISLSLIIVTTDAAHYFM
jgi:hypothetical protein